MAQRRSSTSTGKRSAPPNKTNTKRASSAKKQTPAQERESKRAYANRQMTAVVTFALGVFFCALVFVQGANIWTVLHNFVFGLFGNVAYAVPFLTMLLAVLMAVDGRAFSPGAKCWQALLLTVMICGAVHIFSSADTPPGDSFFEQVSSLYTNGAAHQGGGLFGGVFGWTLFEMFGKKSAGITIILLIVMFLMILTGLTLVDIYRSVAAPVKKLGSAYQERLEEKSSKPRFNIDIPLDEDEMPEHPITAGQVIWSNAMTEKERKAAQKQKQKEEKQKSKNLIAEIKTKSQPDDSVEPQIVVLPPQRMDRQEVANETMAFEKDVAKTASSPTRMLEEGYTYPPIILLEQGKPIDITNMSEELTQNAELLVDTLKSFGVVTKVLAISRGPSVTRYELQPSAGVKIARITSLADDIALNLASAGVRIEAPIPNKPAVGIEVPNREVSVVKLRDIIDSNEFVGVKSRLSVALGQDISGEKVIADLAKMPHVLVAGATGSGKSVCINSMIISLLYKSTPDEVRFLMVDPKVVELGIYNGIPHLLVPVVTDPRKAAGALGWAVTEMLNRYKLFADNQVRDLIGYNELASINDEIKPLPQIVIIIDELADLMMAAPNEVEDAICRLAQMARAAGMHLVIATQRPSVDVITGVIKANIPSRIAFAVSSQVDSRTILDMGGAEKLLGRGDMLYSPVGSSKPIRVQGCFVNEKEIERVVSYIKNGSHADYDDEILDEIEKQAAKEKGSSADSRGDEEADELLPKAIECVVEAGQASTSLLQRRLKLGYARAARIIDEMEQRGIVGPFEGSKPRPVLITRQQWIEMTMRDDAPAVQESLN